LWKLPVPPKVRCYWWRVMKRFVPARQILKERHMDHLGFCEACGVPEETIQHALFSCTWAKIFFFSRTSRRAARHYIKREKRMIQFMRETGPKNHTHEASLQRTPKHTIQAQALSKRQPIRRTIGTQGLKTASHLRQNNSKQTLTPGRHASTHSPPNAPRVGE
jgi:hypothetical protein